MKALSIYQINKWGSEILQRMDTENGGDFTKYEADNFRNFREALLETVNNKVRGGKT